MSLPTRGAWIEIRLRTGHAVHRQSLPTRGAWIEIKKFLRKKSIFAVAPHTGSVD